MPDVTPPTDAEGGDPVGRYQQLLPYLGAEALNELVRRDGIDVLDNRRAYLVNRVRWRAIDEARKHARESSFDGSSIEDGYSPLRFDPADRIADRVDLAEALTMIDSRDASLLWWAASGYSGRELVDLWVSANFEPSNPSEAYVRKRISLARRVLREHLLERKHG